MKVQIMPYKYWTKKVDCVLSISAYSSYKSNIAHRYKWCSCRHSNLYTKVLSCLFPCAGTFVCDHVLGFLRFVVSFLWVVDCRSIVSKMQIWSIHGYKDCQCGGVAHCNIGGPLLWRWRFFDADDHCNHVETKLCRQMRLIVVTLK